MIAIWNRSARFCAIALWGTTAGATQITWDFDAASEPNLVTAGLTWHDGNWTAETSPDFLAGLLVFLPDPGRGSACLYTIETTHVGEAPYVQGVAGSPLPVGPPAYAHWLIPLAGSVGQDKWLVAPSPDHSQLTLAVPFGTSIDSLTVTMTLVTPTADANFDGVVDIFDVNLVGANWGSVGPAGDVNRDKTVNILDVNLMSANWTGPSVPVDEPRTLSLIVAALAVARIACSIPWAAKAGGERVCTQNLRTASSGSSRSAMPKS